MGTKRERFTWSEEKKEWIKTWQPKLRRDINRLTEQVERFKGSVPSFAQEAEQVAQPFLQAGGLLLCLSWKNKFNPLSPEQAAAEVEALNGKLASWFNFTAREDVSQAIASVNRRIQEQKRDQQKALRRAEGVFMEHVNTEGFSTQVASMVQWIVEQAKEMVLLAVGIEEYGKDAQPFLERLLLVHFVRFTYDFDPPVKQDVAQFLSGSPLATMEDLIACAVRSVWINTTKAFLRRSRTLMPGVNDPESLIATYLGQAFEGICEGLKKWKKEGIAPSNLDRGYFTVQGRDFSLDVKPR